MRLKYLQQNFSQTLLQNKFKLSPTLNAEFKLANEESKLIRLGIYRDAYYARLQRALQKIYPKCQQLLGNDYFILITSHYIYQHPSNFYNIQDYGHNFA